MNKQLDDPASLGCEAKNDVSLLRKYAKKREAAT